MYFTCKFRAGPLVYRKVFTLQYLGSRLTALREGGFPYTLSRC